MKIRQVKKVGAFLNRGGKSLLYVGVLILNFFRHKKVKKYSDVRCTSIKKNIFETSRGHLWVNTARLSEQSS